MTRLSIAALIVLVGAAEGIGAGLRAAGPVEWTFFAVGIGAAVAAALVPSRPTLLGGTLLSVLLLLAARVRSAAGFPGFFVPGPAIILVAGWLLERRATIRASGRSPGRGASR